jgi:hypothetical protein
MHSVQRPPNNQQQTADTSSCLVTAQSEAKTTNDRRADVQTKNGATRCNVQSLFWLSLI